MLGSLRHKKSRLPRAQRGGLGEDDGGSKRWRQREFDLQDVGPSVTWPITLKDQNGRSGLLYFFLDPVSVGVAFNGEGGRGCIKELGALHCVGTLQQRRAQMDAQRCNAIVEPGESYYKFL